MTRLRKQRCRLTCETAAFSTLFGLFCSSRHGNSRPLPKGILSERYERLLLTNRIATSALYSRKPMRSGRDGGRVDCSRLRGDTLWDRSVGGIFGGKILTGDKGYILARSRSQNTSRPKRQRDVSVIADFSSAASTVPRCVAFLPR